MHMRKLLVAASLAFGLAGCGEANVPSQGAEANVELNSAITGGYTFGIGSGISSSDLKVAMVDAYEKYFLGGYAGNSYIQGTYSDRFTRYPEALWATSTQSSTVPWLRSAGLFDNEQVWQTWRVNTSAPFSCGSVLWWVTMDYDVDSEAGYDFLVINSSGNTCNAPEVSRVMVSGKKSGTVSFGLPQGCQSAYVTVSYYKDGSFAGGADMGRVKNVSFSPQCSVGGIGG